MAKPRKKTSKVRKSAAPRGNKGKGIKLSLAQVYTARSTGKKSASAAAALAPKAAAEATSSQDLRHQFIMIAARLGTEEAQRLLDRLVDVQTPLP